jgi:hypothetical protein
VVFRDLTSITSSSSIIPGYGVEWPFQDIMKLGAIQGSTPFMLSNLLKIAKE